MYQRGRFSRILGGSAVLIVALLLLCSFIISPSINASGTGGGPIPPTPPVGGEGDSIDTGSSLMPETETEIPVEVEILVYVVEITT